MGQEKRLTGEERQLLVAYLDNEVPEEIAAMLESKIAGSASARREVEELRRTWDLLDFLPMPEASTDFSQRTIEVLTQKEKRPSPLPGAVKSWGIKVGSAAAVIAGLIACFCLGWASVAVVPDPNHEIVRDLPVLERFDEYRAVQSLLFVRALRDLKPLEDIEDPFRTVEVPQNDEQSPE